MPKAVRWINSELQRKISFSSIKNFISRILQNSQYKVLINITLTQGFWQQKMKLDVTSDLRIN
jgi:hypothetical protein